jgi:hypothetical protein
MRVTALRAGTPCGARATTRALNGARAVGLLVASGAVRVPGGRPARSGRCLARSAGAECAAGRYGRRRARHHTRLKRRRAR